MSENYDHRARLEELFDLERQGKQLWLLIGRGNYSPNSFKPLDTKSGKNVWVYANANQDFQVFHNQGVSGYVRDVLAKDKGPHLFMDFKNIKHTKTIPDNLFAGITFDPIAKMNGMLRAMPEFYIMLKKGGQHFFNSPYVGHDIIGGDKKHLFNDACKDKTINTTSNGLQYCIDIFTNEPKSYIQYPTKLPPLTPNRGPLLSQEDDKEIKAKVQELILDYLVRIFGHNKCQIKDAEHPIGEYQKRYFVCTK